MFTLDQVVPWGRSFSEYERMFALTADDLRRTILGCGDGPAAFNAEATRRGGNVVSCDPLYRFSGEQVRARIAATCDEVLEQTRRNQASFVWGEIRNVEELGQGRASEPFFRRCVVWMLGSRFAGTIVAQLLLIPAAVLISSIAERI